MNLIKGQIVYDFFKNEYYVAKDSPDTEQEVLCLVFINDVADVLSPKLVDKSILLK